MTSILLAYPTKSYTWNTVIYENNYFLTLVLLSVSLVLAQTGVVEYFLNSLWPNKHQQFIKTFYTRSEVGGKSFLCSFLYPHTIYKTVFTDYWLYPMSLFASIFPFSKHKSTYTHMLSLWSPFCTERKKVASNRKCLAAVRALSLCHLQQVFSCSAHSFTVPSPASV